MKKYYILSAFLFFAVLAGIFIYYIKYYEYPPLPAPEIEIQTKEIPIKREFGIAVDSFIVSKSKIKWDETLGKIFLKHKVSSKNLNYLLQTNDSVFNPKQIKAGQKYTTFYSKDTNCSLQYLVYEHSPVDYVLFDLRDSLKIKAFKKECTIYRKTSCGIIESSLWEAMKKYDINPVIALELSEIYAWSVDFFGLQKNDSFIVVYDEQYVDSISVGITKIHGARFDHNHKAYYAIPFEQNEQLTFFDLEGNSLRKAFLKAPLRFNRISSKFSHNRMHPILKIRRAHHGVDYAAPVGTPVYSIGDGTIVEKGHKKGEGNYLKIKHNSVYKTAYLHLHSFAKGIKTGMQVSQGQLIGYVGSTGHSTGPHLDFRFWKNGKAVDPLKVESPSIEPVKKENRQNFEEIKKETLLLLGEL